MTTPRATPAGGPGQVPGRPSGPPGAAPLRTSGPAQTGPRPAAQGVPAGTVGAPAAGLPKAGPGSPVPGGVGAPPSGSASSTPRRSKAQRRPPRLASLQLKRVDPWTVLKISLIVSVVMFFVWMIAVGILYLVLGGLDVWQSINDTWATLTSASAAQDGTAEDLVTPGAVFGWSALLGAVNIVLLTALATVAAFVYNAAAGMSGGIELTLGERD